MGEVVDMKEERGEKKKWKEKEEIRKKSSVLGCMIVLFIFFLLYVRCQLMNDGQKTPPLCIDRIADIPRIQ
jgi:hypothetical protein